jgi:riboflavin biosynthesis pyrimidine reductase
MSPATSRHKEKPETTATATNESAPVARQVVLAVAVSLDGYIARRDGSVDWLIDDKTVDLSGYAKQFDVIVAGRKTLDVETPSGQEGEPFGEMAFRAIYGRAGA